MPATNGPGGSGTSPIAHPLDRDSDGINRPNLYKNEKYHSIRETGTGVAEVVRADGTRARLVTRYHDVMRILRDQEIFSREAALDVDDVDLEGTILGLDLDRHAAVRNVVKDWFTAQAIERLRGQVDQQAAEQLKVMVAGDEPTDLIRGFAMPFALNIICDMLGLPEPDRLRFREWGDAFLGTSEVTRADAAASQLAMTGYLSGLIEQRTQSPGDDLLSQITAGGARLPPDQLIKLPIALVVGGWETTASSIGNYVQVLLTHPYGGHDTGYAYLIDHPEAIKGAVTEMERMFSASAGDDMPRRVVRAATLPSGARLEPGDVVIPSHDAANHDPGSSPIRSGWISPVPPTGTSRSGTGRTTASAGTSAIWRSRRRSACLPVNCRGSAWPFRPGRSSGWQGTRSAALPSYRSPGADPPGRLARSAPPGPGQPQHDHHQEGARDGHERAEIVRH